MSTDEPRDKGNTGLSRWCEELYGELKTVLRAQCCEHRSDGEGVHRSQHHRSIEGRGRHLQRVSSREVSSRPFDHSRSVRHRTVRQCFRVAGDRKVTHPIGHLKQMEASMSAEERERTRRPMTRGRWQGNRRRLSCWEPLWRRTFLPTIRTRSMTMRHLPRRRA